MTENFGLAAAFGLRKSMDATGPGQIASSALILSSIFLRDFARDLRRDFTRLDPDIRNGRAFPKNAAHQRPECPQMRNRSAVAIDDFQSLRHIETKAVTVGP